jgi:hypothetical protein
MKATVLYRIAAVLLFLFAVAHTFGFLKFIPPTPEGRAVFSAMNEVHLVPTPTGPVFTYGLFYRGLGWFVTVYLLFSAFLAWNLGQLARQFPAAMRPLAWMFCAVQLVTAILSWAYFPMPPVIFSAVITIYLGWAALTLRSAPRPDA